MMMKNLAPNVIQQTKEYWAMLGIELDDDHAEAIARAYLELIELVTLKDEKKKEVDHEAA